MTLTPTSSSPTAAPARPAESPEEAARQFEAVLVRQFVEVMTKDLFDAGEEGGMSGQADLQRDTLTDTLTDHLVESGTFGVADLMIAQWRRSGRLPPESDADTPADGLRQPDAARPAGGPRVTGRAPMTMDEALRMYQAPKAPPDSFDHDAAPRP